MQAPQYLVDDHGQVVVDDFGLPIEDKTTWASGQQLQEEPWTNGHRMGTFARYLGNPTDPNVMIEVRSPRGVYWQDSIERWTAQVTPGAWEPTEGMTTIKNKPRDFPEASRLTDQLVDRHKKYRADRPGTTPISGITLGYKISKHLGSPDARIEIDRETGAIAVTVSRIEKTIYRPVD
ncbi:hypothetical protein AB0D90_03430 [Streptomyces althioticus]|uniref:Uncharacterized protein n=1 Tax=Streptomyces cellulosae TaxID=1968 RepID=A0ABW6JS60_STRCE